jgi:hypothetical protein
MKISLPKRFGMQFTNLYTDAKLLPVPRSQPVIGGLNWAYYTGNLVLLDTNNLSRPRALVMNDLSIKPPKGTRKPGRRAHGRITAGQGPRHRRDRRRMAHVRRVR